MTLKLTENRRFPLRSDVWHKNLNGFQTLSDSVSSRRLSKILHFEGRIGLWTIGWLWFLSYYFSFKMFHTSKLLGSKKTPDLEAPVHTPFELFPFFPDSHVPLVRLPVIYRSNSRVTKFQTENKRVLSSGAFKFSLFLLSLPVLCLKAIPFPISVLVTATLTFSWFSHFRLIKKCLIGNVPKCWFDTLPLAPSLIHNVFTCISDQLTEHSEQQ